jgi:hypothetical protein
MPEYTSFAPDSPNLTCEVPKYTSIPTEIHKTARVGIIKCILALNPVYSDE